MSRYVTTPIFYVNAAPHLGHAYTVIASDVFARHWRQRGDEVFFLTGTDEHGEPVALAAEKLGVTPQELADQNAAHFQTLGPRLGASEDFFIRTSDPRHVERVQEILTRVKDNGFVEEGTYEGWYCPRCADFKTESEIAEGNRCPIHKIELTREQEQNWFFKLSAFEDRLKALFDEQEGFVIPQRFNNEARAFIDRGLHDVSLSRSQLSWGVPVPWDPEQVFYVWWDALLNYVTALGFAREGEDLTERFWPATFHVIGKDILKFHAVYWPALLMAAGLPVPRHVLIHGFLLMKDASGEETKMSKSLGNVLDPFEIIDKYGSDALRFYLLREVSFGQDGAVSVDGFVTRYESELANDFGNLASRSIAMVRRYLGGQLPAGASWDTAVAAELDPIAGQVAAFVDEGQPSAALEAIWVGVRRLNQYVDQTAPWALAKDDAKREELERVLVTLVAGIRTLAVLLHPFVPVAVDKLLGALGTPDLSFERVAVGAVPVATVEELTPLFPKAL
ncbi:MAG: methionine--tRNA ligase [Patulibacter minatonensis]